MRSIVFFVFGRGKYAAFYVIIDHGRGEEIFSVHGKNGKILFGKCDDLIHIKIKFGKLVPTGNMKSGNFAADV